VVFPMFSDIRTAEDEQRFQYTYREAVTGGLLVTVPLAVFFFVNAADVIQLVFLRGVFDAASLELTSHILGPYAPTIVALTIISISVRASYGRGWAKWVLGFTIFSLAVKVAGTLLLSRWAGYAGISGATSISQVLLAGMLLWLCTTRTAVAERSGLLRRIGSVLLAGAAVLTFLLVFSPTILVFIPGHTMFDAALRLAISALILVVVYVGLMYILGMGSYVTRIARVHK
jgi:putative peptidoglycan lipid II flippase